MNKPIKDPNTRRLTLLIYLLLAIMMLICLADIILIVIAKTRNAF